MCNFAPTYPCLWRLAVAVFCASLCIVLRTPPIADVVLYNPSSSMPRGFYLRISGAVGKGDIVTVRALAVAPHAAHDRRFTDESDRFLKYVAAADGDSVCVRSDALSVNGAIAAFRDARGVETAVEAWTGCRILHGEVLLLGRSADSFDGRYWGPTRIEDIEGRRQALSLDAERAAH